MHSRLLFFILCKEINGLIKTMMKSIVLLFYNDNLTKKLCFNLIFIKKFQNEEFTVLI